MKTGNSSLKILMLFLVTGFTATAQVNQISPSFKPPVHPRILLFKGDENSIKKTIGSNQTWAKLHQAILAECDVLLDTAVLERKQTGRRLLSVSREALRRIFYLSYAFRMSGEKKYMERAEKELLAISAFSDWNPSHFLDVAEMTMAAAIGYDWLYDSLPEKSRSIIKEAILKKGIEPSLDPKHNGWLKATHNWNQVCNAGITYGAMAIYEDEPELATKMINRAIETIVLPMEDYSPAGAYPEGYGYWGYGTSFNVMFISAVEKLFGKDFGLASQPGFLQTAGYLQNMTGPSGKSFNYSDAGTGGSLQPAMFWFAARTKTPSLLWVEQNRLTSENPNKHTGDRLLPAIMIWGQGVGMKDISEPKANMWVGGGKNPVAMMRTSWSDPDAIYVGMKGGSPSVNHGHMDAGSFVMEAGGVRWAMDFGMQSYESLESKGMNIFGRTQDAQRWIIFRYVNQAHNTLTINNQHQKVEGYAPITGSSPSPSFMNAITDLTEVYEDAIAKATRGVTIIDKKYIVIKDEIETLPKETIIRWTLLTPADVKITGKNTAELTNDGKKLTLMVTTPANITMKTWSTDPPNDYDAPNPGTIMTGFEVKLPPSTKSSLTVLLIPEGAEKVANTKIQPLQKWPKD